MKGKIINQRSNKSIDLSSINAKERAFNVWLTLLDELLDRKVPIATAMVLAGQRLQETQAELNNTLFHPYDLYEATQTINLLLRRRPEYQQREKGWSKDARGND